MAHFSSMANLFSHGKVPFPMGKHDFHLFSHGKVNFKSIFQALADKTGRQNKFLARLHEVHRAIVVTSVVRVYVYVYVYVYVCVRVRVTLSVKVF